MKGILFLLGVIGLTLGIPGGQKADAGVNVAGSIVTPNVAVSLSYFEDELAPYGQWVDVEPYGSAWSPYGVADGWRPYWDGSWAYTDYGWTWVSYEPFGWATYHYGRWVFDPSYGWVWIPDTVWGPAWVTWHYNDNWCGWAPLPPSAGWSVSVGFHWVDNDYYIPSHSWCFVETNRFCDYNMRYACAPVARNAHLYDRTWDATRYSTYKGKPVNRGFDVKRVEKWTGKRVERENIADLARSRGKFAERAQLSREQIRGGESRSALAKERPSRELQSRGRERKLNADQARQFQNRARRQELDARELRQERQLQSRGRERQEVARGQEQRLQSRGRERQLEAQRQEQRLQSRGRERQLEAQRQERLQNRGRERQLQGQRQEQRLQSRGRERQLEAQRQEQRLQSRGRERQLEAQRQEQRLQSRGRERQLQTQRQERQFQSRGRERQMNTQERRLQNKGRGTRQDAYDAPRRIQRNERKAPAGSTVVESQEKQTKNRASREETKGQGKGNGRTH